MKCVMKEIELKFQQISFLSFTVSFSSHYAHVTSKHSNKRDEHLDGFHFVVLLSNEKFLRLSDK